jgi:hypothetical protein
MSGGEERFISNLENYNNGEKEKGGEEDNDPNFDRKLDLITARGQPFVKENLLTKIQGQTARS